MADEWDEVDLRQFREQMNRDIRDLAAVASWPTRDDMIRMAAVRECGEAQAKDIHDEAVYRWWNDPVLHARAVMAARLVEVPDELVYHGPGSDPIRDLMHMAAAIALVLAERDPATGERPKGDHYQEIRFGSDVPIRIDRIE